MSLRAGAVVALLFSCACGSSKPLAPSPAAGVAAPSPSLVGTWSGFVQFTSCSSTGNPIHCSTYPGRLGAFSLALEHNGFWTGVVELPGPVTFTATVTGAPQPDGTVVFTGGRTPQNSADFGVSITSLRLRPSFDIGLSGTLMYEFEGSGNSSDYTISGAIASAARGGRAPGEGLAALASGTWTGKTRLESCRGAAHCGITPLDGSFTLVVRDPGSAPRALLSLKPGSVVVELNGTAQPDGSVVFAGSSTTRLTSLVSGADVTRFQIRPDGQAGLLGQFEYTLHYSDGPVTRTGSVLSGTQHVIDFSPGAFHGMWEGAISVRGCVGGDCSILPTGTILDASFSLAQAGTSVVGQGYVFGGLDSVSLAGSVVGGQLGVQGEKTIAPCQVSGLYSVPRCFQRFRNFVVTVDEFGRLRGTFEYSREGYLAPGGKAYAYTLVMEFVTMISQP